MDISPKTPEITESDISVVLIGDFNPVIFHPMWLAHQGLIRENEAKDATIDVISSDISSFRLEWISFQVLRDRFIATIKADAYKPFLGDMVQGLFTILSHTPVRQLGINTTFKCQFKSNNDWHSFGHFLVPKSPWSEVLSEPGMRSITTQGVRDDKRPGFTVFTIEPDLIQAIDIVYIKINDHYDNPETTEKGIVNSKWIVDIIHDNFDASIKNARLMTDKLISNFLVTTTVDSEASIRVDAPQNIA